MQKSLAQKKVSIFEFEYHQRKGSWAAAGASCARLRDLLAMVHTFGYTCFWQTPMYLVPTSGECWSDAFVNADWGNVICAHEPATIAWFRTFVPATAANLLDAYQDRPPHFKAVTRKAMDNASLLPRLVSKLCPSARRSGCNCFFDSAAE